MAVSASVVFVLFKGSVATNAAAAADATTRPLVARPVPRKLAAATIYEMSALGLSLNPT